MSSWKLYGAMLKSDLKAFIWKQEYGSDFFFSPFWPACGFEPSGHQMGAQTGL